MYKGKFNFSWKNNLVAKKYDPVLEKIRHALKNNLVPEKLNEVKEKYNQLYVDKINNIMKLYKEEKKQHKYKKV